MPPFTGATPHTFIIMPYAYSVLIYQLQLYFAREF